MAIRRGEDRVEDKFLRTKDKQIRNRKFKFDYAEG